MPKANHAGSTIHTGKSIPDLRGMSTEAALASLKPLGVKVTVSPTTADSGFLPNTVVLQDPAGGTTWAEDTSVTLTLSHGSDTNVRIEN